MAEITVKMRYDTETGKKEIWIDYESDRDALPFEHEAKHRDIVHKVLGKGVGQVIRGETRHEEAEGTTEQKREKMKTT